MKRNGQIWVETVLYTLIGLALIGLVLGFVMPRLNEAKDSAIIEQTIESLNIIDDNIDSMQTAGNVRTPDFTIKKGYLLIDCANDEIRFVLDELGKPFSEPGSEIDFGRVKLVTTEEQKDYTVTLALRYSAIDIQYADGENLNDDCKVRFGRSSTPYRFKIINRGDIDEDGKPEFSFEEFSGQS